MYIFFNYQQEDFNQTAITDYFQHKIHNYKIQDNEANRKISRKIEYIDNEWLMKCVNQICP